MANDKDKKVKKKQLFIYCYCCVVGIVVLLLLFLLWPILVHFTVHKAVVAVVFKRRQVASIGAYVSRITNKCMRFGVPLIGCGEWSEVAYGKLQGTVSAYMQSLD